MANPINPKLKLFKFPTVTELPNPSVGFTPTPRPPANVAHQYPHNRWKDYHQHLDWYVPSQIVSFSYIIADTGDVAKEFLKRRKIIGETIQVEAKPKRLRQNKLAPTYYLSGRMRSMMGRNSSMNFDMGGNSWSIRELALPFCQMVVLQGFVTNEEMFHPSGWYNCIGLRGNYTHKLVEQVEAWEKMIPGMMPHYALEFNAGNIV